MKSYLQFMLVIAWSTLVPEIARSSTQTIPIEPKCALAIVKTATLAEKILFRFHRELDGKTIVSVECAIVNEGKHGEVVKIRYAFDGVPRVDLRLESEAGTVIFDFPERTCEGSCL